MYGLRDNAKQLRIRNFYKSKNDKLNTVSFCLIKDKQLSRHIAEFQYEGF
jgi:hypothetical protein